MDASGESGLAEVASAPESPAAFGPEVPAGAAAAPGAAWVGGSSEHGAGRSQKGRSPSLGRAGPPIRTGSGYAWRAGQLHFSHVQQFEILAGDGVLVALAQEANVVGIFQVFEARWDNVRFS